MPKRKTAFPARSLACFLELRACLPSNLTVNHTTSRDHYYSPLTATTTTSSSAITASTSTAAAVATAEASSAIAAPVVAAAVSA